MAMICSSLNLLFFTVPLPSRFVIVPENPSLKWFNFLGQGQIGNTSNVFASGIQFDPAALALVKYLPKTNDPCGKLTYSTPSIQNEDQGIGRLDWVQSSKHAVFLRYFYTTYLQPAFERMVCFRTARTAFRFAFVDVGKNVRPGSTMAAWKPDAPGEKFASSPCIGPFIFVRHMPRLRVAPSRALRFC
jgi:hypothetical protein